MSTVCCRHCHWVSDWSWVCVYVLGDLQMPFAAFPNCPSVWRFAESRAAQWMSGVCWLHCQSLPVVACQSARARAAPEVQVLIRPVESALQILTRPFYYAIIDEVDSILIDDCRNPLRITGTARSPLWRFRIAAQVQRFTNVQIASVYGVVFGATNQMHRHPCTEHLTSMCSAVCVPARILP
jgi:SecA DEAD-like domain